MLASARFPVVVSGGGVVQGDAVEGTIALAEHLSAPVVSSYLHPDSFPAGHELATGPLGYLGSKAAMALISRADVVLALGCRLGPFGTLPQYGFDYWPKRAKLVQVDLDNRVLGLTRRVEVAICGDAKATADALLARLRERQPRRPRDETRIAEIADERLQWAKELEALSSKHGDPISPRRALAIIRDALPAGAIVTTDIGNISSVANSYVHFEQPRKFLAAMSFGNCGYSFPAALGAKLASPGSAVLAHVGDGAWGMSLAEVMTAVREDVPVVAVVWNNGQWGAEKKNQIEYYGNRFVGTNLTNPDFAQVAKAMGANGISVEKEAELSDALGAAFESGRPTIVNLATDPSELAEPFRRDALRAPRRLLEKYSALQDA